LYVLLKDGQIIFGTVTTTTSRIEVQTKDAGIVATTLEAIQLLRSEAEHAAHLAEVDRLRNPRLADLWSSSADPGLSLTKGNADTTTIGMGAQAARTTTRDKTSVYFASLFAKNKKKNDLLLTTGIRVTFGAGKN